MQKQHAILSKRRLPTNRHGVRQPTCIVHCHTIQIHSPFLVQYKHESHPSRRHNSDRDDIRAPSQRGDPSRHDTLHGRRATHKHHPPQKPGSQQPKSTCHIMKNDLSLCPLPILLDQINTFVQLEYSAEVGNIFCTTIIKKYWRRLRPSCGTLNNRFSK